MLESLDGVSWARVTVPLGRVVVEFDPELVGVDDLVDEVEAAEKEHGVEDRRFPSERADHPSDSEPIRRALAVVVADGAAIGFGVFARVLRLSPLPVEIASGMNFLDNQPRLRGLVDNAIGPALTDTTLALANAVAQAMAQGPVGLVVDGIGRISVATELRARVACWRALEPDLSGEPSRAAAPALIEGDRRPVPVPNGPIEAHADRAVALAAAGAGLTFAATRDARSAASAAIAAVPKAARVGRLAFVTELGRGLARRGVLVCDDRALNRLDRVDVAVFEASAMDAGTFSLRQLVPLDDRYDVEHLAKGFHDLFVAQDPTTSATGRGFTVGPLTKDQLRRAGAVRAARRLEKNGLRVGGIFASQGLVALTGLAPEPHPAMESAAASVRSASWALHVVGDTSPELARHADVLERGQDLHRVVRRLQGEGHVVLVVSARNPEALFAADCGVGLVRPGNRPPWGAHLLARDMRGVTFFLEGAGRAREATKLSVSLAWAGSAAGGVVAFGGRRSRRGQRALLAVNSAAAASFIAGTANAFTVSRRGDASPQERRPWHSTPADAVMAHLRTGPAGLDSRTAEKRRRRPEEQQSGVVKAIRSVGEELRNPLTPLLAGGAALSAAAGSVVDAGIISSVTGLGAVIGAAQRIWTDRAIAGLMAKTANQTMVVRDGIERRVPAEEVVEGDVLVLAAGDVVPADCRIIEADGLEVDESALTGESVPVTKGAQIVFSPTVAERTSMLYEETTVVAGRCRAVVVATGDASEVGRAVSVSSPRSGPVGVEARIADLTKVTLPVALGGGAAVLLGSTLRGRRTNEALRAGVALAVAAVPEGLPFVVTAAQLAAARRLSELGALVKRPRTIEALGRVDVLCFDKTGTLTEGRLRLQAVSDGESVRGADELTPEGSTVLAAALRATPAPPKRGRLPHPTDQGVVDGGSERRVDVHTDRPKWKREGALDFEPGRAYHATLGKLPEGWLISVKGAPEVVLERCSSWRRGHDSVQLTEETRLELEEHVSSFAQRGLRVLAVAERLLEGPGSAKPADEELASSADGLELLGFIGLGDAPRPRAQSAVDALHGAGVQLVMLTGDHPETAKAVASELGLLNGGRVLTGDEVDSMTREQLARVLPEVTVCARVTPLHKGIIVTALQAAGRTVGMTGDGANDAPAIRIADVGIALGPRSTDAARAAADMVVADARLETLLDALVEGRAIWGSVRDALSILLGGNLGEIGFTVAATLLSGRSPLQARQLLLVNLLTDLAPALALAAQAPDPEAVSDLLSEGPDRSLGRALDREILVRATATAAGASSAWLAARVTGRRARADTVGLVALVVTQLGQTAVTGRARPSVLFTSIGSAALLAAVVQTPGVSQMFGCTPLGPVGWGLALGTSAAATAGSVVVPGLLPKLRPPSTQTPSGESFSGARRLRAPALPGRPDKGAAKKTRRATTGEASGTRKADNERSQEQARTSSGRASHN